MDEQDVRWDAILINKLSKNPASNTDPTLPKHKVSMYRLQILYHFNSDKYYTWYREVDDNTEEGELHGYGSLRSAYSEFKRLFQELALLPWSKRHFLPLRLPVDMENEQRCIFIQPPSEEEKRTLAPWVEKGDVPAKIPDGVPGLLKVLFGNSNRVAIDFFFNDVATARIKAADTTHLDENTLRTAIGILNKISVALTEPLKKRRTRSSATETLECYKLRQAFYLKQCYFGLLGIISHRSITVPECTDVDWLNRELEDVHLLLKLCIARNKAHLFYNHLPREVSEQALQALGLAEIKRGTYWCISVIELKWR